MIAKFESYGDFEAIRREELTVTLDNGATAQLAAEWPHHTRQRWKLQLWPPSWLEHIITTIWGPRGQLAAAATGWIIMWSGGSLDTITPDTEIDPETTAALLGLQIRPSGPVASSR